MSYFEYSAVTCDESLSCIKQTVATGPLTGYTQQEVHPAEITGLTPGREYSYRLVATNKDGTVDGPEAKFTAPPVAPVEGGLVVTEPTIAPLVPPLVTNLSAALQPGGTTRMTQTQTQTTDAKRLARALRGCRHKPRRQRAICVRQAHAKYANRTSGKLARKGRT